MEAFLDLETIAGQDLGGRGMKFLIEHGQLELTCRDLMAAKVILLFLIFDLYVI